MVNYSTYKYKIKELEWQDWDNPYFTLHFVEELSDGDRKQIETEIDEWFKNGQEISDDGFHYMEDFAWPDKQTLKWWIDFGSAEDDAPVSLLNLLSKWATKIALLEIGREPLVNNRKYWYKVTTLPGVDHSKCPFKVTLLESYDLDWALTLYLKGPVGDEMKKKIGDCINNWFQKQKETLNAKELWISDIDWIDNKTTSWWVDGRNSKPEILNSLFRDLSKFSEQIDELIVGQRFPSKEKVDYRTTTT